MPAADFDPILLGLMINSLFIGKWKRERGAPHGAASNGRARHPPTNRQTEKRAAAGRRDTKETDAHTPVRDSTRAGGEHGERGEGEHDGDASTISKQARSVRNKLGSLNFECPNL